jgi:CBS-domain-containing membrane protein
MRNIVSRRQSRRTIGFSFTRAVSVLRRRLTHLRSAEFHGSPVYQPAFDLQHILFSYIGSFIGIAALACLSTQSGYPLIAAPFGATAVLVFGVPDSPLAQPRNVIGGNLIAAIVCVVSIHWFGTSPWVMAFAVATAIKLMQFTKTLHPPSGAVALLGVLSHASWDFILTPVLIGSIIIVLCTILYNNLVPGRSYPKHWL